MLIYKNLESIPQDITTVVTVGSFDGVHIGHQELINSVIHRARKLRATSAVVTFDPHPLSILRPDAAPKILTPLPVKLRLLEQLGLKIAIVLPFTRELAAQTSDQFVQRILVEKLHVKEVHEGANFHFGSRADGDVDHLAVLGRRFGFTVKTHGLTYYGGERVSSSRIRRLVSEGDLSLVCTLLSCRYETSRIESRDTREE